MDVVELLRLLIYDIYMRHASVGCNSLSCMRAYCCPLCWVHMWPLRRVVDGWCYVWGTRACGVFAAL